MAKDRVRAGYGRTINIGNYENIRIDLSIEVDVPDGVNRLDVLRKVEKECDKHLEGVCAPIELSFKK